MKTKKKRAERTASLIILAVLLLAPLVSGAQAPAGNCPFGFTPDSSGFCIPSPGSGPGAKQANTPSQLILFAINILLALAGIIGVLFFVIGGLRYVASRGNEEATEAAKKTIFNAVIGIVIVILAFAIIRIISNVLITRSV